MFGDGAVEGLGVILALEAHEGKQVVRGVLVEGDFHFAAPVFQIKGEGG